MKFLSEIIQRNQFVIENGSHTRDAIIVVLEGRFECRIHGKQYTAGPGDICIFHADTVFQRRVLQPLRCVYVQFEPFPVQLPPGILETNDAERKENTIRYLAQAVELENKELTEHFLRDIILLYLYRWTGKPQRDDTVAACLAYFSKHLHEKISLDILAERFSISKQGLIQKFRKHTGKTPMEYLSLLRINQSKQLLKDTTLPISEIAQQCGYDNVYYFSNHFKHATGISPSGYRKLMAL